MKLNNGYEIPQIGVGTWTLRGETTRENVRLALEAGFRHIDTAQGYENEAEVGQGIAESGVARNEIFVTQSVWNGGNMPTVLGTSRPQSCSSKSCNCSGV